MDAKTKIDKTVYELFSAAKEKVKNDLLVLVKTNKVRLENKDLQTLFVVVDQALDGVYAGSKNVLDKNLKSFKDEITAAAQCTKNVKK
jgi:hypothetical protein